MKIEDSDNRYRELQQDLINALSTEQLLDLEAEVPIVAKKAMRRLRNAFLLLVGGGVLIAMLGTGIPDKRIPWFLICACWASYFAIEKVTGFQWALEFTNSKGLSFCLPKWLNADDDPRRLRAWRESVGQPCGVTVVMVPLGEILWSKHHLKDLISGAVFAVLFAVLVGLAMITGDHSGRGQWDMLVVACVVLALVKFFRNWIGTRFDPRVYGEGYPEIISTLDARGVDQGYRRQR
jgi:hypothetical protein